MLKEPIDWLIVDPYALGYRWESSMRSVCKRIMVIDDLADRQHDCDLLLDQNFGSSTARYEGLVPAHCTQLHGSSYALLKPAYIKRRVKLAECSGTIDRALIYFGGGEDSNDLTGMALATFSWERY